MLCIMADEVTEPSWPEYMFCNLQLLFHTSSRSDNIDTLKLSHISWENDALMVMVSATKGGQSGASTGDREHFYVNHAQSVHAGQGQGWAGQDQGVLTPASTASGRCSH